MKRSVFSVLVVTIVSLFCSPMVFATGPAFTTDIAIDSISPEIELDDTDSNTTKWIIGVDSPISEGFSVTHDVDDNGPLVTPFVIESGAPEDSIRVDSTGRTTFGSSDAQGDILIDDPDGNSVATLRLAENEGDYQLWEIDADSVGFAINDLTNTAYTVWIEAGAPRALTIRSSGDVELANAATFQSSRMLKTNIDRVEPSDILKRVYQLPISEWSYISDKNQRRYVGPMAEDFWDAFGLGSGNGTLSSASTSGVALAAIQGLKEELDAKDAEIAAHKTALLNQRTELEELKMVVQLISASN